ncbi:MAG: helix-turn-helix domain-containing protein [Alloprevotella tannerae]|nr:helix-turn-helix domain-containing protein [Alloprevotella tannerae]
MKTFSSEKIIERLKEALEINSDSALAERLKVTKGTLSNWKARNSLDFEKVFSVCDLISVDWLLTGEGEMLKPTKEIEITPIHRPRSREKKEDEQIVYLYDFAATAGLKALFDNNKQNIIDTIKIPNLPKCDGAIHAVGDSMYPLLKSGDIILYKEIPIDVQNLVYGEMYLLSYEMAGEDYITVKYVCKSERGEPFVTLASENPLHSPCDIDFNSISALALVKASIRINCMK